MTKSKTSNPPAGDQGGSSKVEPSRHGAQPSPSVPQVDKPEPEDVAEYEVGYCRPPAHTQFRPGQSGNPRGRPKDAQALKTLAREFLTGTVSMRTGNGITKVRRVEALLHKSFEAALKGNARALSELLRLYDVAVPVDEDPCDEGVRSLKELARKFLTGGYDHPREDDRLSEEECDEPED